VRLQSTALTFVRVQRKCHCRWFFMLGVCCARRCNKEDRQFWRLKLPIREKDHRSPELTDLIGGDVHFESEIAGRYHIAVAAPQISLC
jgi:hypothetical protein